jgi:copper chaperone
MNSYDFAVAGLTCNHCVMTVTRAVAEVDGVSAVRVDLVPNGESTVHIDSDSDVDRGLVADAVIEAGYHLVS